MTRPVLTGRPLALFVFSNLRDQKGGLTRAWLRRLCLFDAAGWDTHVATIHLQPEIEETLAAWRERGSLPQGTVVHHYQRRSRRFRASWSRPTDETFTRDHRVADWLDWLVGCIPGAVVFADSPVTYAPVAMMRNPYVGRIMTVHLAHRHNPRPGRKESSTGPSREESLADLPGGMERPAQVRSRYRGIAGRPKLTDRFLPFASGADVIVAPTRRQAQHLREDLPGVDVRTIPNIVDPVTAPLEQSRDLHVVVQLGRLDPVKRIDHSLRAVQIAHGSVPELHLDIYGKGPDLERLQALSHRLGLDDVVSFRGFTEEPDRVLAGAGASLLTSRREGFGLAVAESLAAGTPVISYDVDYGPAELVVDGVNGRLVPDGSIQGLADALVEVLSTGDRWAGMSQVAPQATAALAGDVVGHQWVALAEEVAGRVDRPDGVLLVEDLRIRRRGLVVAGVALGTQADTMPVQLELPGAVTVPLEAPIGAQPAADVEGGPEQADVGDLPPGPSARPGTPAGGLPDGAGWRAHEVDAALKWPHVAGWPMSGELRAASADGRAVPVVGPGLTRTVVPTDRGVVLLGPDEDLAIRRLPCSEPIRLEIQPTQARATVDEDTTVLTDGVHLTGRLRGGPAEPAGLEIDVDEPGLLIADGSELIMAARVGDRLLPIGAVRVLAGTGTWSTPDPSGRAHWTCHAAIDWDARALLHWSRSPSSAGSGGPGRRAQSGRAAQAADGSEPAGSAALLSLAAGRRLRQLGPVDFVAGRPVSLRVGGRWVLAATRSGRAMLVPGRGARIRAASVVRRLLG